MANPHTFGLCMIVKDAVTTIGRILENSQDIWDQIVIVDTDSTDGTIELLQNKFPFVQLEHFEWVHDFSKARNYALSFITTDSWMWLDADDVFDHNTALEWRNAALKLTQQGKPGSHIALPYFYRLNERDEPIVIQYRERIFLKGSEHWEWRGPVHEACFYIGPGKSDYTVLQLPVLHKPTRTEEAATNRNVQILKRAYDAGDRTSRTLYYLMKDANARKDTAAAIAFGQALLQTKPGDPLEYEAGVGLGYAYLTAFRKNKQQADWDEAAKSLRAAIVFDPRRNEARTLLVEAYVDAGEFDKAIQEANALSIEVPKTPATLEMALYGAYKFEVLADVYLLRLKDYEKAWRAHLDAMRSRNPSKISKETHFNLIKHIQANNIAVVFFEDENFNDQKRSEILAQGFSDVWATNHPFARQFVKQLGPNGLIIQPNNSITRATP